MMLLRTRHRAGLVLAIISGLLLSLPPTAWSQDAAWEGMINTGRTALQQRNFSEAERQFEAALEAAERFPPGDPRLGKSYNNLAAAYYAQEDYARAEPLMRRALSLLQESLGPEDAEVAQTMKNLAALYFLQGSTDEAEKLLKQSLAILEKVHGPNHAYVATVLSNLAGLYQAEDRYQDAEPLLTRSLAIWENLLGADHPDVARSRELLTQVRAAKGDAAPAAKPTVAEATPNSPTPLTAAVQQEPSVGAVNEESAGTTSDDEIAATDDEAATAAIALDRLAEAARAEDARAEEATRASTETAVPAPAVSPIRTIAENAAAGLDLPLPAQIREPAPAKVPPEADDVDAAATVTAALSPPDAAAPAIIDESAAGSDASFAVYLSTLWSMDEAKRYWQALRSEIPDLLDGKRMEIEEVTLADGRGAFYRVLTTPFASDPDAQAACEQIKSRLRTHDCNVVVR